jgi:hypothetical protein
MIISTKYFVVQIMCYIAEIEMWFNCNLKFRRKTESNICIVLFIN